MQRSSVLTVTTNGLIGCDRFGHIAVDVVVAPSPRQPHNNTVVFVTSLEGSLRKYVLTPGDREDGGERVLTACLVEQLDLHCDVTTRAPVKSMTLDKQQVE